MAEQISYLSVMITAATSLLVTGFAVPLMNEFSRRRDRELERQKQQTEIYKLLYPEKIKAAAGVSGAATSLLDAAQKLTDLENRMDALILTPELIQQGVHSHTELFDVRVSGLVERFRASVRDEIDAVYQAYLGSEVISSALKTQSLKQFDEIKSRLFDLSLADLTNFATADLRRAPETNSEADLFVNAVVPAISQRYKSERAVWKEELEDLEKLNTALSESIQLFKNASDAMETAVRANHWLLGSRVWEEGQIFIAAIHEYVEAEKESANGANTKKGLQRQAWEALDQVSRALEISMHQKVLAELLPK